MTGLVFPADLRAWRAWHESRHPIRAATGTLRGRRNDESSLELLTSPTAEILVCIEATHASVRSAVASSLSHLPADRIAIVCPPGWDSPEKYRDHVRSPVHPDELSGRLPGVRAVLAAGNFTPIGSAGHIAAVRTGAAFFVSQHGALTPFAPPLPPDARLLAWSDADASFWQSGRLDIEHEAVGSQLLWQAAKDSRTRVGPAPASGNDAVTYLGQLHGSELSRTHLARAAASFCREHAATYRPHPSERDKLSRLIHIAYRRAGISVDASAQLADLSGPVVSVFSTGVLEAAAQGRDAWVHFPRPPAWLGEFWERYAMSPFGHAPTHAPALPEVEPARRIAQILTEAVS